MTLIHELRRHTAREWLLACGGGLMLIDGSVLTWRMAKASFSGSPLAKPCVCVVVFQSHGMGLVKQWSTSRCSTAVGDQYLVSVVKDDVEALLLDEVRQLTPLLLGWVNACKSMPHAGKQRDHVCVHTSAHNSHSHSHTHTPVGL